ncbi:hypothetical protein N7478_010436 [Penicillium angulare]|uniref:uncharacterized protein n=1 Tax=Penicillium angulare TaxID=116970 RepID=UPI00254241C9|nr:uncharacterized protein N7478_010436 [Penicillium angulare]KAJ5267628.1 hypothetical protein N7478_010436 [Penicillium angulare]
MSAADRHENVWAAKYYAIAIGSMMFSFIMAHWIGLAFRRHGPSSTGGILMPLKRGSRTLRRGLDTSVFGIGMDKWILYLIFWGINLILILTNVDLSELEGIAKRMGWITIANFTLLVFLALRSTPLAPLSGQSYEKLRPLHKVAGYTCIVSAVLHGILFLKEAADAKILFYFSEKEDLVGAIAGLLMVIIGISTIGWFARNYYEIFYIMHVVLFMVILILVGMHRPKLASSTLVVTIFIACMWFVDRALRFLKLSYNFFGNYATITPMQDGAVRVKLRRSIRCSPGSHAFLWMPAVRFMETHPFTMISSNPAEFLIRTYDGYTRELYKFAQEEPGRVVRCSVDGGYGQVPDFRSFDKVVLVSGGSGATFTFAIALLLIRQLAETNRTTKSIDFIWTVRHASSLAWFENELSELQDSPYVNLFIHVSQGDELGRDASDTSSVESTAANSEMEGNKEKLATESRPLSPVRKGRPDVLRLVTDCISQCPPGGRVGVGACGPMKLLRATREATSQKAFDDGPSINLHTEEFEW